MSTKVMMDATAESVWHAFVQPNNAIYFNCFVAENSHTGIQEIGHNDVCTYYSGLMLHREVVEFIPNQVVKFKVWRKPENNNNFTIFKIHKMEDGIQFELRFESDAYRNIPRPLWFFIVRWVLIPSYKKYFESVTLGMKHYCETHQKVKKNQFGYHKRFSSK